MLGQSKLSWRVFRPLWSALLVSASLAVWIGQRVHGPATSDVPPDDWDIPRLVAHLNDQGLGLRMVSTLKTDVIDQTAFLTTTNKKWQVLNRLPKDHKQIDLWRGTLYCELGRDGLFMRDDWSALTSQWGDCCLVIGPFLFYGDRELLGRVRAALAALSRSDDRLTPLTTE
jgi:hypothetical protein